MPEFDAKRAFDLFLESIELRFRDGDVDADTKERETAAIESIRAMYTDVTADLMKYPREDLQLPRLKEWLAPNCLYEWFSPVLPPFVGRRQGREAVYEQVLENFSALDDQRPEIQRIIAQGTDVAVFIHETGRLRHGGQNYTVDAVQIFTLEEGLVTRFQTYGHMDIHGR